MDDNFILKNTNYVSILENDLARTKYFYKWIRFLNEHSIVNFCPNCQNQIECLFA